ncbi:hypothetical protein [Kribbella sp. NBC_00359]|uniref:hypothetical protein n=1 Tax=Kribbella sp. NBC_00359 TaxID=2975966 RepID=UPI002E1EDBE1
MTETGSTAEEPFEDVSGPRLVDDDAALHGTTASVRARRDDRGLVEDQTMVRHPRPGAGAA